jgi:hypothetical protein
MAGTMPHAVFVETGLDPDGTVAAYAAELPGCASFAPSDDEAVNAIPRRVRRFMEWLRRNGENATDFVGDNWYEVERAAAADDGRLRAVFTLDELPPSDEEWARWTRWLELAREELAEAIDRSGTEAVTADPLLAAIPAQDQRLTAELGAQVTALPDEPMEALYVARDALTDALDASGPSGAHVRRAFRLAIADDLRLAERHGADG